MSEEEIAALVAQNNQMRQMLGEIADTFNEIHRSYGSTSVCWGGIGGAAITQHCAWECDNQVHNEARAHLRTLLGAARHIAEGR